MTAEELIEMAISGKRIPKQPCALHNSRKTMYCYHNRGWRTIVCNGEKDVCECPICGGQKVMRCNFDEEYD